MSAQEGRSACRVNAIVTSDIHTNRHAVEALNRVFDAYINTITNEPLPPRPTLWACPPIAQSRAAG
jgi:hypothetical protein